MMSGARKQVSELGQELAAARAEGPAAAAAEAASERAALRHRAGELDEVSSIRLDNFLSYPKAWLATPSLVHDCGPNWIAGVFDVLCLEHCAGPLAHPSSTQSCLNMGNCETSSSPLNIQKWHLPGAG